MTKSCLSAKYRALKALENDRVLWTHEGWSVEQLHAPLVSPLFPFPDPLFIEFFSVKQCATVLQYKSAQGSAARLHAQSHIYVIAAR